MSAAAETRIFGIRVGLNPKILLTGLIAVAGLLFWHNLHSDDESAPATAVRSNTPARPVLASKRHIPVRRPVSSERGGTLRLRPIDATQGDVDPTLRLDLLTRLQFVKPEEGGRNLFELGPPPMTPEQKALLEHPPNLVPKPLPPAPINPQNAVAEVQIPLQYYGFVKSGDKGEGNRGLFLDGDNVLVASEGELLKQRYLVVELKENSARMEDVEMKKGKDLPVVPVAQPQP